MPPHLDNISCSFVSLCILDWSTLVPIKVLHGLEVLIANSNNDDAHGQVGGSNYGSSEKYVLYFYFGYQHCSLVAYWLLGLGDHGSTPGGGENFSFVFETQSHACHV